jgi:eukaryotic-like serine/threonine-protein kinase
MVSLAEGTVIAGKYRLERALAHGGMGSVWVARHLQLEIDVAMKFMGVVYASSPEGKVRFEREARASAQLRSPYVVHMYDYGAEEGSLFLVMELLQGEDLDARLRRTGTLAPAAMSSLVEQVCKGLECAHDAGIVHRDLKPANLFLARQGREEVVKLLDFGIAKSVGPALASPATRTGTLIGSPHYMSPEQVRRSKEVDPRSDLWSLGVILFQCLTGRLPFAGNELGDVLVAICSDPIPLASQIVPGLGPEVDRFLTHALTRDPGQRFQSARELAEACARVVDATGRPVGAHGRPAAPSAPAKDAPPLMIPAAVGAFTPYPGAVAGGSGPPVAAMTALPAGAAPSWGGASPSISTLAPAGATFSAPSASPGRASWVAVIAAVTGSVVVLGLAVFVLSHLLRSPGAVAGSQSDHAAQPPVLAASSDPVPPVPSPEVPATGVPAVPASAVATPSASAAASSGEQPPPAPRPTRSPPSGKVPVAGKPTQARHDPLEHR